MIYFLTINMIIVSIFGIVYLKKTVDTTASIIYGIYSLLIIVFWVLFLLKV